jgi:hypothetical protein
VDTAARYGGEEFAIILPQANLEGALVVAERLRARIEREEMPGVGCVTASLGVASFPVHASSRDLLVLTADRALYQAKRSGRNRVCSPLDLPDEFPEGMHEELHEELHGELHGELPEEPCAQAAPADDAEDMAAALADAQPAAEEMGALPTEF